MADSMNGRFSHISLFLLLDVLDGKADDLPETAFFMVGDLEEARSKAVGMAQQQASISS